jgi:hypothetical protein
VLTKDQLFRILDKLDIAQQLARDTGAAATFRSLLELEKIARYLKDDAAWMTPIQRRVANELLEPYLADD